MKTKVVTRSPELESIRSDLLKLKIMWGMCCITPVLYLLIAQVIARNLFLWQDTPGFFRLAPESYRALLLALGGFAVLVQGLILIVRYHFRGRMTTGIPHATKLLNCYTRRTLALVVLSELTVASGFVMFLLNGQLSAVFMFGLVGLVYYAQSYPSESGLHAISRKA